MDYQAIFIDLDGTLLNSDHHLEAYNRKIVTRIAEEYEIPIILSSGRPPQGMMPFYKALGLQTPMMSFNGGLVNNPLTNSVISEHFITLETAHHILKNLSGQNHININYFRYFEWYCTDKDKYVQQEESIIEAKAEITESLEYLAHSYNGELRFHKILGVGEENDIEEELKHFKSLDLPVNTFRSTPNFIDFMAHNISKGRALESLCGHAGWDINNVIAIGDGENDIEMLQKAGLSIVMNNAKPEIKAHANHITASNNDHGVGKILEEIFVK